MAYNPNFIRLPSGKIGKSGYRGVHWKKNKQKWQAIIKIDGKNLYLGYFNRPEEAARAYDKACVEQSRHPNFLNFPDDYAFHQNGRPPPKKDQGPLILPIGVKLPLNQLHDISLKLKK